MSNVFVDFRQFVVATLSETYDVVAQIPEWFQRLERAIMATANELVAAFNAATDEVAADLEDLRDQLRQAVADKDQAVQDAVEQVLAQFDQPLTRLQQLGADPDEPIPAPGE